MQKPQGKNVWTLLKDKEKDPCEAQAGAELAASTYFKVPLLVAFSQLFISRLERQCKHTLIARLLVAHWF